MTKETAEQREERRMTELVEAMTNKQKREITKHFDTSFFDLDGFDNLVALAWLADSSKSLDEYDDMPLGDVKKVVVGE